MVTRDDYIALRTRYEKIEAERDEARAWARRFYKERNSLETNLRVFDRALQECKEQAAIRAAEGEE